MVQRKLGLRQWRLAGLCAGSHWRIFATAVSAGLGQPGGEGVRVVLGIVNVREEEEEYKSELSGTVLYCQRSRTEQDRLFAAK